MRPATVLTVACIVAAACLSTPRPAVATAELDVQTTLTYLGEVGGQQRYRIDYALTNLGDPYGFTAFQVFFNSDPAPPYAPSGDRATLVSFESPAGWGDVYASDKNAAGQWSVNWDYDFATPPGPVMVGETLTGFAVVFDWNDPGSLPPVQHAQARNGSAYSDETVLTTLVGLVGSIGGRVNSSCFGPASGAAGVSVSLLHEAEVIASTTTLGDGTYAFDEVVLGSYTVLITPPSGFGTTVDHQIVSLQLLNEEASADFALTCQLAAVSGTVSGTCNGQTVPLQGVTVDLYSVGAGGQETLLGTVGTDAAGGFSFPAVALGEYQVVIVTPLGYVADANSKPLELTAAGAQYSTSFHLTCQTITAQPRSIGYWKRQVNAYRCGKGRAHESLRDLLRYTDLLLHHFNSNIVNPVVIYVPTSNLPRQRLRKLEELLVVNRCGSMLDRAKQQLLALLLNVVSGKISQTEVISPNGATVSQAITHVNDLIQDGDRHNDELAKDIAEYINNGESVPAGLVPNTTRMITYRRGLVSQEAPELELAAPFPNPARGPLTLAFAIPSAGRVDLRIFDVSGRVVRTLVTDEREAGFHQVAWDATDDGGRRVAPGVYYSRLVTADGAKSRTIALER